MIAAMRVGELWRYPVKSLQGESVRSADVGASGLAGDRSYAIFDVRTGFGLTARREPELLFASASLRPDGSVRITLPDGSPADDDAALSGWLGRRVELRPASDTRPRRYENPSDPEDETARWDPFDGSSGAFHDSGRAALSLLTRASVGSWDPRRFRANLLLERDADTDSTGRPATSNPGYETDVKGATPRPESERAYADRRVEVGEVVLDVNTPLQRCVMTTRPQPGGLGHDLDVLRTIHRECGGRLAMGALVVRPGRISVGDSLRGHASR